MSKKKNEKEKKTKIVSGVSENIGKYSQDTTENHPFSLTGETPLKIRDVIKKECGSGEKFREQTCFQLDDFDKKRCAERSRSGVDIVFSLTTNKVLLVEAKFRVVSEQKVNSVFKQSLNKKLEDSIDILGEPPMVLRSPFIILANDKMASKMRAQLYRLGNGSPKGLTVMSEDDFFTRFFE